MSTDLRAPGSAAAEEAELVARLRAGDEKAFEALVEQHYGTMLSVARTYVKTRAVAEEVVQEAWLGVIAGLERFEGRASLKTWILRILVNTAKTRGVREARSVPFASLRPRTTTTARPWTPSASPAPRSLSGPLEPPAGRLARAARGRAARARDARGRDAPRSRRCRPRSARSSPCGTWRGATREVCAALGISEGNQRVLLHRARSRVRAALERRLDD